MADEIQMDEEDVRELVERVRKHPIIKKPSILDCYDHDLYILYVKSYNRHNLTRDHIDLGNNDFLDKRFSEFLGDDY